MFYNLFSRNDERAFTLVEMLVVLLIIAILILLIIPNIANKTDSIQDKGCSALIELVQAQVLAYELDNDNPPNSIDKLVEDSYIKDDQKTCPNGKTLKIENGIVQVD